MTNQTTYAATLTLPMTGDEAVKALGDDFTRDILAEFIADAEWPTPIGTVTIDAVAERDTAKRAGKSVPTVKLRTGVSKARGLRGASVTIGGRTVPIVPGSKSTGTVKLGGADWHGTVKCRDTDAGFTVDVDLFEGTAGKRGASSNREFH